MYRSRMMILLFGAVFGYGTGLCQGTFSATVHIPGGLDLKRIYVVFDDGKDEHYATADSDVVHVEGRLQARFASISVYYRSLDKKVGDFHRTFWIGKEPADIYILPDSGQSDPVASFRIRNAYDKQSMGQTLLDSFQHREWTDFEHFVREHTGMPLTDSIMDTTRSLLMRVYDKELRFIREHPDLYFSFWLFRRELTRSYISTDTLFDVFNTLFPDSVRKSPEGQEILKRLNARVNTQEGKMAPDYTSPTTSGKMTSPSGNKGKYVLLDFWASWCGPCIREMPRIRALRKKYAGKEFELISITLDDSRKYFDDAVAKNKMDWPQIFGNADLIKAYNITVLPELFLIDPEGRIIYTLNVRDPTGQLTNDYQLKRLSGILRDRLEVRKN